MNNKKYIFTQRVCGRLGKETGYIKDKTVSYFKAKAMIIEYIESMESITNKIVQDLCGYDERKVRYTLKKIREEGIIDLKKTERYSCYLLFKPTIIR